jgi:peptidoglycan/LPS O-acetylase OafA/YrhL
MWLCHVYLKQETRFGSAAGLFFAGLVTILAASSLWDYVVMGTMSPGVRPYLNNLFQFGAGCIVYSLLVLDRSQLLAWVSNRGLQIVGMMTYSIYVWHGRLIAILRDQAGIAASSNLVSLLIYLAVLSGLSLASYRYIEFRHVKDARLLFKTPG